MKQASSQPIIKVVKIGNCSTLSGKGSLGYQVGCNTASEIFMCMSSNSGGGWFSTDWISLQAILSALDNAHKPLTSYALQPLFKGKSVNTPAFLFAALKQEGLVAVDADNPRCHTALSPEHFIADIQKLIAAGTDLKVETIVSGKSIKKSTRKMADDIPVMFPTSDIKPKTAKHEVNKP